jgi:hypothetical protein
VAIHLPSHGTKGGLPRCARNDGAAYAAAAGHPPGLRYRSVEPGASASICAGRLGRSTRLPAQFGHTPCSTLVAHSRQNVHSNVQMNASPLVGGKSQSQHSQFGRNASIPRLLLTSAKNKARRGSKIHAVPVAFTPLQTALKITPPPAPTKSPPRKSPKP